MCKNRNNFISHKFNVITLKLIIFLQSKRNYSQANQRNRYSFCRQLLLRKRLPSSELHGPTTKILSKCRRVQAIPRWIGRNHGLVHTIFTGSVGLPLRVRTVPRTRVGETNYDKNVQIIGGAGKRFICWSYSFKYKFKENV